MYCSNCGAELVGNEPYCPYCGVMNPHAAEKEYMEKLEDIRTDTEKLGDEAGHETRRGVKHAGSLAVKVFVCVVAVILLLTAFYFYISRKFSRSDAEYVRSEAAFKEQYFPKLDELYEAGDDKATADYMQEIIGNDGATIMSRWKHYKYMKYYMDYQNVIAVTGMTMDDDFWKRRYADILYDGIELIYQTEQFGRHHMSSEEKEKVKGFGEEAERIFAEYFGLSKSDLDEIYKTSIDEGGYLYDSRIREWAEKTGGK